MQNKECGNIKKYKTNKFSYLLLGFNDGISTISQLAINFFFKSCSFDFNTIINNNSTSMDD